MNPVKGKGVLIKPNFNTADLTPGSTHNDTLVALVEEIWAMGARSISLGERGYPPTNEVMHQKGILSLMDRRPVAQAPCRCGTYLTPRLRVHAGAPWLSPSEKDDCGDQRALQTEPH